MAMNPKLVGRRKESEKIRCAFARERNVLIEGPVGVGKTFLVSRILEQLGRPFERVDGDSRYTEQKLTGWFDPPLVLKKGYKSASFVDGPLTRAMRLGGALFINELNRMPEAVQNILLPVMDERKLVLPRLGGITAKPGFVVVATQNPREFTATHALSEALMDRFEMVRIDYQTRDEERAMLVPFWPKAHAQWLDKALDVVRATRSHPAVKRGASIRAAIAVADLLKGGLDFETTLLMALPGRIELVSSDEDMSMLIQGLLGESPVSEPEKKKKIV
jgi:MoxR-like ATPase